MTQTQPTQAHPDAEPKRYYRRVIRIRGEDSPNVRYAQAQLAKGLTPTDDVIVPGVLRWSEYVKRRAVWDKVRQCIGLDAQFYVGAQLLLFPPTWLDRAHRLHEGLRGKVRRALAIGVDPAEGGDETSMAAVDEYGLIELVSRKTPNTSVIQGELLAFMNRHGVGPERVCIDRGGGGKQIADAIERDTGLSIRTVAFGSPLTLDPKRGLRQIEERMDNKEEKYAYVNIRAQMFWELSAAFDPLGDPFDSDRTTLAIPSDRYGEQYAGLRRELSPIDKLYDKEGRCRIRAKNRVGTADPTKRAEKTLVEIIGHSPDRADSLALAVYARDHEKRQTVAGCF